MEDQLSEILRMFDNYVSLIENPRIISQMTPGNVPMAFNCCRFVEKTMRRVKEENKTREFMSNLQGHWSLKNRVHIYSIETLENACDKLVEVLLKTSEVPAEVVDKLLTLYVGDCGRERLHKFLEHLFNESLMANATLECMTELRLDKSLVENEGRLFIWHSEASRGNLEEVTRCIDKMIEDGFIGEVIESVVKLEGSPAKKLVIQSLGNRLNNYDENVCWEVMSTRRKILEALTDDEDFLVNYTDVIFYFGRSMNFEKGWWSGSHRFSFDDIVNGLKALMGVSEEICRVVKKRILSGKELIGGGIWGDVEDACVNEMYGIVS
uniref:RtcA_0 protein n=1 Tax=Fopius arisanus TaxID=64838 RepID=A0A0C9PW42_9HYME